ncbi:MULTISPECIES: 2-oxoacid:acceptor oxidoreductase [unclassified Neisseria]|uniref:2-oxoacid:acceptor oxidoreductase n=1 Tax=unclassified Neisseria TaxID=2623750 RepID=UPI0010719710|nr:MULTISPECIES: 2-oxoacid:acceptor oxidoreductase [unclassified Neisseria]MBF0802912.1 2-oxoacid:acceptor oxidoreductase [Neisseria sp. 19428wB4_WF04]TFU44446.1 2-oxoacid:acceptor oxidoreductase [Neisseria sp. WF04]
MGKLFEIFKSGKRMGADGTQWNITDEDVQRAAEVYDPKLHEAPVVVGHPKTDAPAYGWIPKLSAESGSLSAEFAQMDDDFAAAVKAGRYKKVSASFWPPGHPNNPVPDSYYLRHVGFLGAHPPAVKGLRQIEFADGESGLAEFSEYAHRTTASIFRHLRDWLIEQYDIATANQVVADWEIRQIEEEAARNSDINPNPAFAESETQPPLNNHEPIKETNMATEEQLAAEKAAREKAEAEAAAAKAELKKLQNEQEQDLRDASHQKNADFAEGLVKAGRLKPADKALVVQALDFAEYPGHTTADFGEGDAKKPLGEALRGFLNAVLPKQLPTGELAKGMPQFAEGMSHHERALGYQKEHGCSYEEAARRTAQD